MMMGYREVFVPQDGRVACSDLVATRVRRDHGTRRPPVGHFDHLILTVL